MIMPTHCRTILVLPMIFAGTILPLYLTYARDTRRISRKIIAEARPRLTYLEMTMTATVLTSSLSAIGS